MAQIELRGICKTFHVSLRPEGRFAALRGAFVRRRQIVKALE